MIKTAVIGASGFLGGYLINKYRSEHPDSIGTSFSKSLKNMTSFDIKNPDIEPLKLEQTGHKNVIIASYKSKVDYCENEQLKASQVNVDGVLKLIKNLSKTSLKIIFLSSDYVFDGYKGKFNDNDSTNPSTSYGKQKKHIEDEIKNITDNFLVLRLSKIYGLKKGDKTILDEGANLLYQNKEVLAAEDQYLCPTYVEDLVEAIIKIQEKNLTGFMNVCSPEIWNRFSIFNKLAMIMNRDTTLIKKIKLHDIPEMKGRPLNTSMVCEKLNQSIEKKFIPLKDVLYKIADNYES